MSTRSVIAVGSPKKWVGIYHHWDGYPLGVGVEVFELAAKVGQLGILQLLKEHPAGFSSLSSGIVYKPGQPMIYRRKVSSWIEWIYVADIDCMWVKCCYCKIWASIPYDRGVEGFKEVTSAMCKHGRY
jgi:hypothetical protein